MALTPDQVRALASQARLGLADDEAERMFRAAGRRAGGGCAPARAGPGRRRAYAARSVPLVNVMRDDAVRPSLPRDAALAAAPEVEDGFVKVPRVVEGDPRPRAGTDSKEAFSWNCTI